MSQKANVLKLYKSLLYYAKQVNNNPELREGIISEIRNQFNHHKSIPIIEYEIIQSYLNDGYNSLDMLKFMINEQNKDHGKENNEKENENINKIQKNVNKIPKKSGNDNVKHNLKNSHLHNDGIWFW
jgi:hypothetical protein